MSALLQTLYLSAVIVVVYVWLHIPFLSYYSLQAFTFSIAVYFLYKFIHKSKFWHIAPQLDHPFEMGLVTFAVLLLIGSTGNTQSPLYVLSYMHLFFLVFATPAITSIVITLVILLFHFGLSTTNFVAEIPELLSLPFMLFLFLFTKYQHQELLVEKLELENEEQNLSFVQKFLRDFVIPKLTLLKNLSGQAFQNQDAILSQVMLIEIEINKLIDKLDLRAKREKKWKK